MIGRFLKVGAKIVNPEAAAALLKGATGAGKTALKNAANAGSALPANAIKAATKVGDEFVRPAAVRVITIAADPKTGRIIHAGSVASAVYPPARGAMTTAEVLHQAAIRLKGTNNVADGAQVVADVAAKLKK